MKKLFVVILIFALVGLLQGQWVQLSTQDAINRALKNSLTEIGKSAVSGKTAFYQVGLNATVGTTDEDVTNLAVPYVYMTRYQLIGIVSSSTSDDTSGTGVTALTVYGIDSAWAYSSEQVRIAGTDTVWTAKKYWRVFDVIVDSAGTGLVAAGNIKVGDLNVDTTLATIATGALANRTQMAILTVPVGKTFYMTSITGETNLAKATVVTLYVRPFGKEWYAVDSFDAYQNLPIWKEYTIPLSFPAKSDIAIKANSAGGSGHVTASFRGWWE